MTKASNNLGSFTSILINGKKPKKDMLIMLDQVYQLHRSVLQGKLRTNVNKLMKQYYELEPEHQIRDTPNEIKQEFVKQLKGMSQASKKHIQGAPYQKINDINDTTTGNVLPIELLQDTIIEKKEPSEKYPYESVKEIMMLKDITIQEKMKLIDAFIDWKNNHLDDYEIKEIKTIPMEKKEPKTTLQDIIGAPVKYTPNDNIKKLVKEVEQLKKNTSPILVQIEKLSPLKAFELLCKKIPTKFINERQGKGRKIGLCKTHRGNEYFPILISSNKEKIAKFQEQCLKNSKLNHLTDMYYIKGLDTNITIIRGYKQ